MTVLLSELSDKVQLLTINRPDKLNALNAEVMQALREALHAAKGDSGVGAVVLTGSGTKAFVAGADIAGFQGKRANELRELARSGQVVLNLLEGLGKPTIAAINGFALGGGLELAMACSIRIASRNAKVGQPEVNLGLIPGYGGTQRLPRLVGKGRAMEMILTADPITAEEAHRIGLVNRVVEPDELLGAAKAMAAKIVSKAPLAVRYAMDAINHGPELPQGEALRMEADLFGLCGGTADMQEGVSAFLGKRPAAFRGE
jgi:enoyl-CoA hydratase